MTLTATLTVHTPALTAQVEPTPHPAPVGDYPPIYVEVY